MCKLFYLNSENARLSAMDIDSNQKPLKISFCYGAVAFQNTSADFFKSSFSYFSRNSKVSKIVVTYIYILVLINLKPF